MRLALTHTATHWRCLFLRHPASTAHLCCVEVPAGLFHEIASHLPYIGFTEVLREGSKCDLRYNREASVQSDRVTGEEGCEQGLLGADQQPWNESEHTQHCRMENIYQQQFKVSENKKSSTRSQELKLRIILCLLDNIRAHFPYSDHSTSDSL